MKFCTHCGKQVLDDAVICPGCGCSVQYENRDRTTPPPSASPANNNVHINANDSYSALSIAGLVCSFFAVVVGFILSIIAYNEAKRTGSQKSKSMSTAGIVISSVELGLAVLAVIVWVVILIAVVGSVPGSYPSYY